MIVASPSDASRFPASGQLKFEPLSTLSAEVDAGVLDIPRLSADEFAQLERAVLTHQVVVVRGQKKLSPRDQFELTRRFDPEVKTYGHGMPVASNNSWSMTCLSVPWPNVVRRSTS